ncbi:hypothetical protein IMZ48_34925, partial [Candidatus Bathyarchaeota archaeon]|nr:hypothetical protein [Candidatus Bathyarchaeota archaeon]
MLPAYRSAKAVSGTFTSLYALPIIAFISVSFFSSKTQQLLMGCRNSQTGANSWDRQRAIIEGQITDGALFPNMLIKISSRIMSLAFEMEKELFE